MHAGRYLVGVRGDDGPLPGLAEFPGGKCQPDESPAACAVRECREETGLAVVPVRLLLRQQFEYPHGAVDLHFWLCEPADPQAVADDHAGFRWVGRGELRSLPFPEGNRELLALLCE